MSHAKKMKATTADEIQSRSGEANTSSECPMTESECTLDCLTKGQKGRVSAVAGPNRCRLMELGFTRGTEVEVARRAAFGGPMLVQLRSYQLSLRPRRSGGDSSGTACGGDGVVNPVGNAFPNISEPAASPSRRPIIALVGNPNSGKTTLFNSLTGMRQKVGNYPGVTVERKEGSVSLPDGSPLALIDLPGLYSLTPHSPDERIARDVLLGYRTDTPRPDAILNVVDASNLERNLYLTSQLMDLGLPVVVALTMTDTAREHGIAVDAAALERELGVPVRVVVASRRVGMEGLLTALGEMPEQPCPPARHWRLPPFAEEETAELAEMLQAEHGLRPPVAFAEALLLLGLPEEREMEQQTGRWSPEIRSHLQADRANFKSVGLDFSVAIAEARYGDVGRIVSRTLVRQDVAPVTISERLDRIFLHRFWGYAIFLTVMYLMFQTMFSWAKPLQEYLQVGVDWIGKQVAGWMPPGDLQDLVVNGILGGVGNTVVFLPQILILFLFVSALEDTGYLARAAFLMDRLMSRVGLHGKSFIPLLSSYGCAIPGIMATRTIDSEKARILTILVAPLMSCSARLPVYSVMIAAFIPNRMVAGFHIDKFEIGLTLPALTLFAMYALGTVTAFGMAALCSTEPS